MTLGRICLNVGRVQRLAGLALTVLAFAALALGFAFVRLAVGGFCSLELAMSDFATMEALACKGGTVAVGAFATALGDSFGTLALALRQGIDELLDDGGRIGPLRAPQTGWPMDRKLCEPHTASDGARRTCMGCGLSG